MKIVFIADALDTQYAGIHFYCKELLAAFDNLNPKHQIFVIRSKKSNLFKNVKEVVIPIGAGIKNSYRFRQFSSIPNFINKIEASIAFETAHFGPFRISSKTKKATFIHDLTPIQFPHFHSKSSTLAHKFLMPRIVKNADKIFTNSKYSESSIQQLYPLSKNKTAVTYLASKKFNQKSIDYKALKEKFKITKSYLLFTGTIEPRKNLKNLLIAFDNLEIENKPQLLLAGKKGWIEDSTYQMIQKNKNVVELGYIKEEELAALYQNALAFVFPSLYEGFGIPVLEAMQNDCPVLCSNTSVLPEIVGDAALQFNPNNANEIKKAIEKIIRDQELRQQLIQKGKERVKFFSWKKTAKETLAILESM